MTPRPRDPGEFCWLNIITPHPADARVVGAPSWCELLTPVMATAQAFYDALFGWTAESMPGQSVPYTIFKLGDRPVAGMMELTDEMRGVPPCWMTSFTVSDADAREAVRLGATVSTSS